MAAKKKPAPKKVKVTERTYYAVLTSEDRSTPFEDSFGTYSVFEKLDDAVYDIEHGLGDTKTPDEIERTKSEFKIVRFTEIKYDIIPKTDAKITLV